MKKIETDKAPSAVGPYSQGVSVGEYIFVSGQIPIDPSNSKLVEGDISLQTRQVLSNIQAILEKGGSGMDLVVKVEIFLKDLKKNFNIVNDEYATWFSKDSPPARQTIEVSELPLGAPIEMSCIALRK